MNTARFPLPILLLLASTAVVPVVSADLSHRQSAVTVEVRNLAGDPVPGATVEVDMINPAFRFGTAITEGELRPGNAAYSERGLIELQSHFNSLTFGNYMKWSYVEGRPAADTLGTVADARARRPFNSDQAFQVRGHATVWGAEYQLPLDVRAMTDPTELRNRIRTHVTDYHTLFRDSGIVVFDLYNEPFHERATLIEKVVPGATTAEEAAEVAEWFKNAAAAHPEAQLYINDYNMLNFWRDDDEDIHAYKAFVDAVRDAGGPVGGIGLQAHMDRYTSKERIVRRLNILAAPMAPTANHPDGLPGLPIEVTELDINTQQWSTASEADQAEVVANVLDASFEHPSVEGITMWGMRDSLHWRDNAVLYDDSDPNNWRLKPSGAEWINRVNGTWWTDESGTTDAVGNYSAAVFKGLHRITVRLNGNTVSVERDVTADGSIVLQIDDTPVDTSGSFLSNLSVRAPLGVGETLKLGFVVSGGEKEVLARVGGPVLGDFGLSFVPDPQLEVRAGEVVKGANDNWVAAEVRDTANALGAYPFAEGSADAATLLTLSGPHTSEISGDAAGIVLGEVYDVSPGTTGPRLVNVSALHQTGVGDDVLTAGFYVGGTGKIRLLIRGVGPGLESYGVPGRLTDPLIRVFQADGTFLNENDDWDASLTSTFADLGAFALPAGSKDAAMVVLLDAGQGYTVQVVGADDGVGRTIVEVYEMD